VPIGRFVMSRSLSVYLLAPVFERSFCDCRHAAQTIIVSGHSDSMITTDPVTACGTVRRGADAMCDRGVAV
jgi:hypothetical protein